jgi:predicted Rossmann-fold nucleotide-binding protein
MDWLRSHTLDRGFVSEKDFDLLRICDTPEEVIQTVQQWYIKREIVGRRAVVKQS